MKVLIVSQYFWPEQFRINDLAQSLKDRGHDVAVLTGMPNYPEGEPFEGYRWRDRHHDTHEDIPVHRVPLFLRRQGRGWQLALNYLSFAVSASTIGAWFLRNKAFDVIFVFEPSPFTVGIPAVLLRRLKKAPVIFWVQDLWPESLQSAGAVNSPAVLDAVRRVVGWIYRRCDRVLVQSRGFIEPAVAAGAIRGRITYFPNWAEDFYQPLMLEPDAAERSEIPEGFCLMFAGNMGEAQSLETLLGAAIRLRDKPDIQWVMVGDGRRRAWLENAVSQQGLGPRFHFLGRKPAEQMPRYFALADAMLVTLKDEEVFARTIPSKVQSYLACGKPVVAALNGEGAAMISNTGAGIAVGAENAGGLADAVLELRAMSPVDRDAMGRRGRDFFEKEFTADKLVNRLESIMRDVREEGLCES